MASWKCSAARDLPTSSKDGWDGAAAKASIFAWAGWPDNPDPGKAAKGFLAYDAGAGEQKGSYKLPFAQVLDGKLTAVKGGIAAAASRLPQTDIPDAVKGSAQGVIDAYEKKLGMGEEKAGAEAQRLVFAAPAAVFAWDRAKGGSDRETLLARAQETAQDPAVFDEHEPFFWRADISTGNLDSYYTTMHPSTLKNFARDAAEGRAFQNSHRHTELPLGYSLTGTFHNAKGEDAARTTAEFYTLRGVKLGEVSTDDFIAGVRGGLVRDVSVGFHGGQWVCSICGKDMLRDYSCPHMPGLEYPADDEGEGRAKGKKKTRTETLVLCTADIQNAGLGEVSACYDGATPGAAIHRAGVLAEQGRLRPDQARLLEERYRSNGLHLPQVRPIYRGVSVASEPAPRRKERRMNVEEEIRALLGLDEDADVLEAVRRVQGDARGQRTEATRLRGQIEAAGARLGAPEGADVFRHAEAELDRLRPLAKDGEQYRKDTIDAALKSGVRARGDAFDAEHWTRILNLPAMGIADIQKIAADWEQDAQRQFPAGRKTNEEHDPELPKGEGQAPRKVPASLYGGRKRA